MRGRIYDPKIARFLQADPIVQLGGQGLNRYTYAYNNPSAYNDPSGLLPGWVKAVATIVGGPLGAQAAAGWDWAEEPAADAWNWAVEDHPTLEGVALAIIGGAFNNFTALPGAVNGWFAGSRQIYDWGNGGFQQFIADSTWGILGTTLGDALLIANEIKGFEYSPELSRRQGRQVYLDGVRLQSGFAFTQGNVISNICTYENQTCDAAHLTPDQSDLLAHETKHVSQNRSWGPGYVGSVAFSGAIGIQWGAAVFVLSGFDWDKGVEAGYRVGYYNSLSEYYAYKENPGARQGPDKEGTSGEEALAHGGAFLPGTVYQVYGGYAVLDALF